MNLLIVVGILLTIPVMISALQALWKRRITVDLLASIALVVSILDHEWRSVIFINLMIISAKVFGMYTEESAKKSIQNLLKLRPTSVKIKKNNQIKIININDIKIGDVVVVEAGERIAVDGIIESGRASIDQSSLTGESLPIEKKKGDMVLSSTLNMSGSLLVKVNKLGNDTTFEKLIKLMETAQLGKNNIETLVDKFASRYILITLLMAIIVFVVTRNMSLVLSLLLVTCADDIAVAIPLAFWAAIATGAKYGVIVKGGNYLEALAHCKMLIVDKTGTLTKGKIKVIKTVCFGVSENSLIHLAVMAESMSDHPMAKAVVDYATRLKIKYEVPDKFRELPGKGMEALWRNKSIIVGNMPFIKTHKIKIDLSQADFIKKIEAEGHNMVLVASEGMLLGIIAMGDEIKWGIKSSIANLKRMGVGRVVMLTGDNQKVAQTVAQEVGITEYYANLLPEDKLNFVKKNINSQYKVAMVGDGINDAAALAISDIGFAMGAIGTDSAIEAANVALMNDDFGKIAKTVEMSRFVMEIVKENFIIWGVVNSIGLVLVFGQLIGPTGAAAYNFISDFLPLLNSMRVINYKFRD